jgi:predicted transcriptional regulator
MEIDVLQALNRAKSLKITHIMYKANVNCTELKAILVNLQAKCLITAIVLHKSHLTKPGKEHAYYAISPEGQAVLHSYRLITSKMGEFD